MPCSNVAAKTRNLLKFAGVPQTRLSGDFLHPVFFSEPRAARFRSAFEIYTKAAEIRRGKKEEEEEETT